jgi:hypothetical protein
MEIDTDLGMGGTDLGLYAFRIFEAKGGVKDVTLGEVHDSVINWFSYNSEFIVFLGGELGVDVIT